MISGLYRTRQKHTLRLLEIPNGRSFSIVKNLVREGLFFWKTHDIIDVNNYTLYTR